MHVLKEELLSRGLDAWMRYEKHDKSAIGVYPEIVAGNPEGYEHCVKWLLNDARPEAYEHVFVWDKDLGQFPQLKVDIIERDLWRPFHGKRSGVAYWVGKGKIDRSEIPDGAVAITRSNFPTREELAEFVRSLEYLISFDPFTAVTLEATLCGTPVVIPNADTKWAKNECIQKGIAWGWENLGLARETVFDAFDDYERQREMFQALIDQFVEATQQSL